MAILIAATTAAVTSKSFTANQNNTGLLVNGLAGSETVKVQVYDEASNSYIDALIGGVVPKADVNNNMISMTQDAFTYRVVKSATAIPVGVAIYQNLFKLGGFQP